MKPAIARNGRPIRVGFVPLRHLMGFYDGFGGGGEGVDPRVGRLLPALRRQGVANAVTDLAGGVLLVPSFEFGVPLESVGGVTDVSKSADLHQITDDCSGFRLVGDVDGRFDKSGLDCSRADFLARLLSGEYFPSGDRGRDNLLILPEQPSRQSDSIGDVEGVGLRAGQLSRLNGGLNSAESRLEHIERVVGMLRYDFWRKLEAICPSLLRTRTDVVNFRRS